MPAWKNASWQPPVYLNLPHFAFIAPLAGSFIFRWGPQQINLNLWSSGRQGRKPCCWIVWRPGSIKSHQTHSWDLKYLFLVLLLSFHSWLLASRLVKSCIGIWLGFLCVKFHLYLHFTCIFINFLFAQCVSKIAWFFWAKNANISIGDTQHIPFQHYTC